MNSDIPSLICGYQKGRITRAVVIYIGLNYFEILHSLQDQDTGRTAFLR